jgi:L-lactate dehydrogenase complex protein LldF
VVCTNEGNADLGTALPDLHIACMGLEKVIPSVKELGVLTRLLARSATGQAITTYTSHFFKPKPGGRLCVVIVDNGRSARLGSDDGALLSCLRCGACMNTCPVYRRSGGHSYGTVVPGPIGSALAASADANRYGGLSFACTLCASCDGVCPAQIDLHGHLLRIRRRAVQTAAFSQKRRGLRLAAWLLRHPALYGRLMSLYRRLWPHIPKRVLYGRWNLWGAEREMPVPADRSFAQMYRELRR